jgi:photosystem II stability/assembly factor-like uncharacterized protein
MGDRRFRRRERPFKHERGGVMKKYLTGLLLFCLMGSGLALKAQSPGVFDQELLKTFEYRALGPARQGGRILRIEVPLQEPYTFYVVTATGGLWKTENNGTTFKELFLQQNTPAIGDLAIAPSDPNILYVGTGTAASGRITLRGDGVYKSTDAGETWTHIGLEKTIHIGRIAVHPRNPDVVYVAALGYHFTFNPDRGLYKSIDGGKTWNRIHFLSDKVGFVEVVLDPTDPDTVYTASYDKHRVPWQFWESGPLTAIYKSTDAGANWTKLTEGLPTGNLGRVGIAVYPKDTNILYASIENGNKRPPTETEAAQDKRRGREAQERTVGREVYRSDDAGQTWRKMNEDKHVISGGKWYGIIYIDPNNPDVIYVPSVPLLRSEDGGKTWGRTGLTNIAPRIHVDHHAIWVDPDNSNHVLLGNDGGLAVTWDYGKTWDFFENLPIAQYYAVGVDMEEPYNIYGGLQDNGSVKIPSNSIYGYITAADFTSVGGGDGMFNLVDPNDGRWLYNESQFGSVMRTNQKTGERQSIRPQPAEGDPPYRLNWTTPLLISPHNSRVLYMGTQKLLRSLDQGDNWQEISPDLTTNDTKKQNGNIEHCMLTTISESPLRAGLIWVGSDDGKVQLTKNGGGSWEDLTPTLTQAGAPAHYYVRRVFASNFDAGKAYVVKTGFQYDDFKPLVFKTEDFGKTWTSISSNLPPGTIHVIVEDRINPNLLFIGREFDVQVTIDGGKSWLSFKNNMPTNEVYDLLIHPRENDLVVATHGRGIFVTDITPLQEMSGELLQKDAHLFKVEPKIQWRYKSGKQVAGDRQFVVPNERVGIVVNYYLKNKVEGQVRIVVSDPFGQELASIRGKNEAGLQQVVWNMRRKLTEEEQAAQRQGGYRMRQAPYVEPGAYVVTLEAGGAKLTRKAVVRAMPGIDN